MTTQLTAPMTTSTTHVTLDGWELVVIRNPDLTVNVAESYLLADLVFRAASGAMLDKQRFVRKVNELPAAIKTTVATLQNQLVAAARAAGIVPAGTDTADI